jgi:hypothetical protein
MRTRNKNADMELVLKMLAAGVARFDGSEFCFNGLRYSHGYEWTRLLDIIGRGRATSFLEMEANKNNVYR